ncbi:MAG: pilin [Patescibacteria group bacterium]
MRKFFKKIVDGLVFFSPLAFPLFAKAQDEPLITDVDQIQPAVEKIVTYMYNIFWVVAVGFIVWAAFLYLTAGGSEEKVEKAKKYILYAVISAAIVLLANGIKAIITSLLGS